uniref:Uncharacterized protein n=1 Tax=Glossina pallidipes TaxID=7398 RepID=A0A1A9Z0K1_GLOPL
MMYETDMIELTSRNKVLLSFWSMLLHRVQQKNIQLGLWRAKRPLPFRFKLTSPTWDQVFPRLPPIDLLSVDLVYSASLNPAVGDKDRDTYRDLALRDDRELMEMLSPPKVSYAKAVKSSTLTTAESSGESRPSTASASLDASTSVASLTAPNGSYDVAIASVPSIVANEQRKEEMEESASTGELSPITSEGTTADLVSYQLREEPSHKSNFV